MTGPEALDQDAVKVSVLIPTHSDAHLLRKSIPTFLEQLRSAIGEWTFWVGIIKAPFFALIISLVGCYEGFNVARSADSVGRLTTQSVVEAIFLVIVADAAFSILFSLLKI